MTDDQKYYVRRSFAGGRKVDRAMKLGEGGYGWVQPGTQPRARTLYGSVDTMIDLAKRLSALDRSYQAQRLYTIQVCELHTNEVILGLPHGEQSDFIKG